MGAAYALWDLGPAAQNGLGKLGDKELPQCLGVAEGRSGRWALQLR